VHLAGGAEVVRIPALPGRARHGAELGVVPGGIGRHVLVVSGRRLDPRQERAPGRIEAPVIVRGRAVRVGDVAEQRDRPGQVPGKRGHRLIVGTAAVADVADRKQRRRARVDAGERNIGHQVGSEARDGQQERTEDGRDACEEHGTAMREARG